MLRLFEALAERQQLSLRHCSTAAELRHRCAESRPDVLVIDADLGAAATLRALRLVRETLCNDWSPVLLLGGNAALHRRLAQVLPGAVDYRLAKPLGEAALAEHQAALRRTVTLRRVSRSALDRVSEAVIVIDERGRIRSFNGAAEGLFQWRAPEVIGRNVSLLVPEGHRAHHDQYIERYRHTAEARIIGIGRVEQALRKDGSRFPMQLTVADISDGNVTRFVGVIRDLSLAQQRDELQQLVRHDSLTGLPNRAYVTEALARSARRWAEGGEPYSVLFCDVDGFKAVNDTHGHHVGDEVLKAIARRLRGAVCEQDFVARLAGDEFIVVLHGVSSLAAAQAIGRRVAAAVAQPLCIGDVQLGARVSIGAATPEHAGQGTLQVLELADRRMYEAKRARRG
ncbi:diguanylate cyclase domain-containing protein [Aquabacterium sp.]|uniref:diguanylate cyclase domain-containing protein n=1 Tax=Aquabacterium sp. TaxID=1872578 RepID=UPI003785240D